MSSRGCMVAEKHTTPRSDFVTSPKYSPISSAKAWMVFDFRPCQSQAYSVVSRLRARTKDSSGISVSPSDSPTSSQLNASCWAAMKASVSSMQA